MNQRQKKWLALSTGWGFIALGVLGLFLPVLQGVLFLLIGLVILSGEYIWARNLLTRLTARFPSIATYLHKATAKVNSRFGRTGTDSRD